MIYRVNGITIETTYNADHNVWFASAYDNEKCYFKNRRLREGVYQFLNGVIADVDYGGKALFKTSVQSSGGIPVYSGTSFSVAAEETNPQGITWDGTHFWVVGDATDAVYKYTSAGVYTSTSFSIASEETIPTDITWDGTHFWVVGRSNSVHKYDSLGVYTDTSFSVTVQENIASGIAWDGTHFWVVGLSTDTVYKYTSAGVYTGISFSVTAEDTNPESITWDGTHFWVVGTTTDTAYKYDYLGVYTGISFSVAAEETVPWGIMWDSASFWVVGLSGAAHKYLIEADVILETSTGDCIDDAVITFTEPCIIIGSDGLPCG